MRIVAFGVAVLAILIGFQNCSKDMGPAPANNSSTANPAPGPGPLPLPTPNPGTQVQPNATNAMADVKPVVSGNCPMDYGLYDLLNTTPAISGTGWEHSVCVKPYANGGTSVISDAQLVAGTVCPSGFSVLHTIAVSGADFSVPRWAVTNSICTKSASVPVTASFITYFYFSAPGANCRTNDVANGEATFCSQANSSGVCMGGQIIKFCRAIQ